MVFSILLAATGLTLSAVAIYYSVIGLTAVFAAAFWPIVIMGTTLEVAKLVAASWLKMYWERIPKSMKIYMTTAVVVLMLITSMGIFGFLSKAHLDQNIVSGDVVDRVAIIDEKIRTERENIEASRKALKQMDEAVDQVMARSDSERGAERAVQIRRQQQAERTRLQNDIAKSQTAIAKLNEEKAPIAKDLRKVEAEVGPIKYIAKLIYGDNPDTNILEKAVTWVIMIIVFVFDPLAVLMLLGAQMTLQWRKEDREDNYEMTSDLYEISKPPVKDEEPNESEKIYCPKCNTELVDAEGIGPYCPNKSCDVIDGWKTFAPTASEYWPFPKHVSQEVKEEPKTEPEPETKIEEDKKDFDLEEHARSHIPKESDIVDDVGVEQWNKMLEEAEKAVDEEKERMRQWKEENPDSTIKEQRLKKEIGLIDELPWENAEVASKEKRTYIVKDGDQQVVKTRDENYVQNAEQTEETLWQKIQNKKSNQS